MASQFVKEAPEEHLDLGVAYDVYSVMHYNGYDFANKRLGPALTDLKGEAIYETVREARVTCH